MMHDSQCLYISFPFNWFLFWLFPIYPTIPLFWLSSYNKWSISLLPCPFSHRASNWITGFILERNNVIACENEWIRRKTKIGSDCPEAPNIVVVIESKTYTSLFASCKECGIHTDGIEQGLLPWWCSSRRNHRIYIQRLEQLEPGWSQLRFAW